MAFPIGSKVKNKSDTKRVKRFWVRKEGQNSIEAKCFTNIGRSDVAESCTQKREGTRKGSEIMIIRPKKELENLKVIVFR